MNAQKPDTKLIAVIGPTASGKTRRAVSLAQKFNGEIVSADSRQLYRGMTIGTGKDLAEYGDVPYHLIDVTDAGQKFNLYQYLRDANEAIDDIAGRGRTPIVCGGTGLYVESLLNGITLPEVPANYGLRTFLDGKTIEELTAILATMKKLHNITDVDTPKRAIRAIEIQTYYAEHPDLAQKLNPNPRPATIIGIGIDRENRRRRITERLRSRLDEGMVDEIRQLLKSGIPAEDLIYYGLEYRFVTLYAIGQLTFDQMFRQLETAIHQFAKRQMTWFRGMKRRGFQIEWLPYDLPDDEFLARAQEIINNHL